MSSHKKEVNKETPILHAEASLNAAERIPPRDLELNLSQMSHLVLVHSVDTIRIVSMVMIVFALVVAIFRVLSIKMVLGQNINCHVQCLARH